MITVLAKPFAREDKVEKVNDTTYRVFTTAPAEKGQANRAIQKLLAKQLGVATYQLTLVRGKASRLKRFEITETP